MKFANNPHRQQIEPMHEILTLWANYYRDRTPQGVSITYVAMMTLFAWNAKPDQVFDSIDFEKKIRLAPNDTLQIALKVQDVFERKELWSGHLSERHFLMHYYSKVSNGAPIGRIAHQLGLAHTRPRGVSMSTHIDKHLTRALLFFRSIWQ